MAGVSARKTSALRGDFSSASAASHFTTLEEEYATLYHQRHHIGVRMEEIKRSLTAEQYTALMAKLDPQKLATLKSWSDTGEE
jgi:hypothetical protein